MNFSPVYPPTHYPQKRNAPPQIGHEEVHVIRLISACSCIVA